MAILCYTLYTHVHVRARAVYLRTRDRCYDNMCEIITIDSSRINIAISILELGTRDRSIVVGY